MTWTPDQPIRTVGDLRAALEEYLDNAPLAGFVRVAENEEHACELSIVETNAGVFVGVDPAKIIDLDAPGGN